MAGEAETGHEVQTQETEPVPSEDLKGPEDEGSLASILERGRHRVLTEHPTAGGMGAFEAKPEEEEASPEEETNPPEEIPPGEEKPPDPPEFQPKHQTWQETEKARLEAEQKMHTATEEAANLRKELDALKEKDVEKETAQPPEPPTESPKPVTKEERKARVKTALATIRELDETDPDYDEKVAEAWAEAGVGGSEVPFPDKDEIAKAVAQQVRDELKADDEAQRQKGEEERQNQAKVDARTKAEELATGAGLNMAKGTADYRLFWDVAQEIPNEQRSKPFSEQVQWAVGEVRRLKGDMIQGNPGAKARAQEIQRQNAVLERGSSQTTQTRKPPESETYTLGGIINSQLNARRI